MIPYNLKDITTIIFDVDGVLSKETISLSENGEPMRTVNIKDGYGLQLAIKLGLRIVIMTGGNSPAIKVRFEKLGITDIFMGCARKIDVYRQFVKDAGLKNSEVMYVGDDIPDYEVMKVVGCPCCPKDAAQNIKNISIYVSPLCGGEGCGRDVVEQVLRAKELWMFNDKAFGW